MQRPVAGSRTPNFGVACRQAHVPAARRARRGLAAVAMGLLAQGAFADVATYSATQTFTASGGDANQGFTGTASGLSNMFPQFNPAAGTLTGVSLFYSVTVDFDGSCTSSSIGGCDTRFESSISGSNGLSASDGSSIAFIFGTGDDFDNWASTIDAAYQATVAQGLAGFIGTGSVGDMLATVTIRNENPPGGSTQYANLAADFVGNYQLNYTYAPSVAPPNGVPEPGVAALSLLGLICMLPFRRRRDA